MGWIYSCVSSDLYGHNRHTILIHSSPTVINIGWAYILYDHGSKTPMISNGLLETDQIYFVLALPYFLLCGVRISVQDFETVINRTQSSWDNFLAPIYVWRGIGDITTSLL